MSPSLSKPRKRTRSSSTTTTTSKNPSIESSLLSLLIRSFLVLSLVFISLLLAIFAWFSLKSFLKVDPIIGKERVWLQYGEFRQPYAFVELPKNQYRVPGDSYDLSLELKVPNSEQNFKLGNFMVSISLLNKQSETILNDSRPAILLLNHPPPPSTTTTPSLLSLPFLPGRRRSMIQELELPLLESVALNRGGASNGWDSSNKVEKVYLQIGRKDSHPEYYQQSSSAIVSTSSNSRLGNELQVYESFLKIKVKLYGLRALIRSHPYVSFSFFFPIFLTLEFLTAFIVYTYFVLRPSLKHHLVSEEEEEIAQDDEDEDGIEKVLEETSSSSGSRSVKTESSSTITEEEEEEELTSEPPSTSSILETDEEEERIRRRRSRKAGRTGMTEISGETQSETEEEEETAEETETGVSGDDGEGEGEGSEEWAAIEGEREEKPFDDSVTIGGSETTRASRSTFGPSVTGTTSSNRSTLSGLRERQSRIKKEEKEEDETE
ncbi:hypothetical protein JCM5350_000306 [Sporobolomyces pararoseus]